MATPIVSVVMRAHVAQRNSDDDGNVNASLQLVAVKAKPVSSNVPVVHPNQGVYHAERGGASLTISNVTDEVYKKFDAGRRYRVTVEEIAE